MTADDFIANPVLGRSPRPIEQIVAKWELQARGPRDDSTGMMTMLSVLGIDAAIGDGLLNEVPPDVQAAMEHLMGEKADTYDEARELIRHSLAKGNVSFEGFVRKIQGQIGEDRFVQEYPDYALATSKSQEAVDALRHLPDSTLAATQVKAYADADAVIRHMLQVQAKVDHGFVVEGDFVSQLNFSVPADIADDVRKKMLSHPELANIHLLPIHVSAFQAAQEVRLAGENITNPIEHLGGDVLESVALMAALDTLTNAFLLAKGKKTIADVVQEAALKTPIGAVAIATSKSVALGLSTSGLAANPIVIPLLVAVTTRRLARSWYEKRFDYARRLRDDGEWATLLATALANKNYPILKTV